MRTRMAVAICFGVMFVVLTGRVSDSAAEVDVNIGIGVPPLPQVVIAAPPPVVVIPGTYAYFAPEVGVEIFFYHGYWYRPHHGHWFRARAYNGPWGDIKAARVPRVLRDLPPDFRHKARHHEQIRHADLKKNWRTWEKKKHWDKHDPKRASRDFRNGGKPENNHGKNGGKGKHER